MRVILVNDRTVYLSHRTLRLDVGNHKQPVQELIFGYWSAKYFSPLYHEIFKDPEGKDIVFSNEFEIEEYAGRFLPGLDEFNQGH